jgi:hypothetical protein
MPLPVLLPPAAHVRLPAPSVCKKKPLLPPVIVILPTLPKSALVVAIKLIVLNVLVDLL